MPHFYKTNYRGIKISAHPVGFRRLLPQFISFYWVGQKPQFRIKTVTGSELPNFTLPVYEWFSNEQAPRRVGNLGPFEKMKEKGEITIEGFYIPTNGTLEYWINMPHDSGSWKIADFKGNWREQIGWMFLSAVFGSAITLLIQFILKIVSAH